MTENETIPQLIGQHKGRIMIAVIGAAVLAFAVSFLLPRQYLSEASVLPSNSKLMDQQRLFGENIQELYSAYGASDDLDRLMASMHSTTVLQGVVDSLKLVEHYKIDGADARTKAYRRLLKHVKLSKSEYGEIRLKVWDEDPAMALQIAVLILNRTQQMYDDIVNGYYDRSIARLQNELQRKAADTTGTLAQESALIRNRIYEYKLARINAPAAFFVLNHPEKAVLNDKPDILLNTVIAALIALFTMIAWLAGTRIWKNGYANP